MLIPISELGCVGRQQWSYSEVDIALDSESKSRGFESHYDHCLQAFFHVSCIYISFFFRQGHFGGHHQKVYMLSCELVP
uniref:Uncharacterized protein n=1 Tax=Setaria italica TaxID=4555 RepID=K3XU52_SETIT